jgi:hypothetical protein
VTVQIDGQSLTLDDVLRVARGRELVAIAPADIERMLVGHRLRLDPGCATVAARLATAHGEPTHGNQIMHQLLVEDLDSAWGLTPFDDAIGLPEKPRLA